MNSDFPPLSSKFLNPSISSPSEWEVKEQKIDIDSLIVRHDITLPRTVAFGKSNYHHLAYELSPNIVKSTCIGDEEYTGNFARGEFCLCPASYSASYSLASRDEVIAIAMKTDFLVDIAEQSECLNPNRLELTPVVRKQDLLLGQIAESFLREISIEGLGSRLYLETLATQLAIHLLRNYSVFPLQLKQYSGGLSPSNLQKTLDYIAANLDSKISLNNLAQIVQISPTYFLRLFKQSIGMTPYRYITQQKIELGKRLLQQGKLPIIEIAMNCGFASQSSFTKTFRRVVGITPKAYQKQL